MLTGKELGQAIDKARKLKGVSKADMARHFDVKPPSIQGWINTGRIDKSKLIELFSYFSDTVTPEHWGLQGLEAMLRQELSKPPSAKRLTATLGAAQMLGFGRFGSVVSPEVLARWESSGVSESEVDLYHEFEESLEGVFRDIEDDLSEYSYMTNLELAGKAGFYRKYPVISSVEAGSWQETVDLYQPGHADDWEASSKDAGPHGFWLRVKGDSMTAPAGESKSFPDGMLILVNPDMECLPGHFVVAKLTDTQEATFKRYIEDAGQRYLKPLNPAYPLIPINGNCRFVGRVIEAKLTDL